MNIQTVIARSFSGVTLFYFLLHCSAFQLEHELLGEGDNEGWVQARNNKGDVNKS